MEKIAHRFGWALVLRGILAILFGLMALFWTGLTIKVLVLWFGAYAFVTGIFGIIGSFQAAAHHQRWFFLLFEGLVGIGAGVFTFLNPGSTALILVILIAVWAVLSGAFEISAAFTAPWSGSLRAMLGISGALSVIFGILIYLNPVGGALSITWILGAYSIAFGIMLLTLGLRLQKVTAAASAP